MSAILVFILLLERTPTLLSVIVVLLGNCFRTLSNGLSCFLQNGSGCRRRYTFRLVWLLRDVRLDRPVSGLFLGNLQLLALTWLNRICVRVVFLFSSVGRSCCLSSFGWRTSDKSECRKSGLINLSVLFSCSRRRYTLAQRFVTLCLINNCPTFVL